jgi:ELWxxDGT repeat protein
MPGDNQLSGAVNVGIGTNISGRVGKRDLDDLYRFSSTGGSSLDVNLSAIVPRKASKQVIRKTRVGVEIYKLKRPFDEISGNIGNIDFSNLDASDISANFEQVRSGRARSTRRASFAINPLDAGEYVIRVRQNKLEGRYRLSIGGTLIPDPPVITPDPTPAPAPDPSPDPIPVPTPSPSGGNSLGTALPLTLPVASQSGFVNDSDQEDFYSFSVPAEGGDYKFNLSGLTADANIEILDSAGTLVKAATASGNQAESLVLRLNKDGLTETNYYIKVLQGTGGAASNYSLSAALLTDNTPGTLAGGAASVTTTLTPTSNLEVVKSNYVLDDAKNSTEDIFKINVSERSFLNVELKGLDGGALTGNLDVELYGANGAVIDPIGFLTSSRPGTSAELFGGTLKTGEYYIRIRPGTAGTGEGSEYSLSMSLNPKNNVPTVTRDINYGREEIFEDGVLIGIRNNSSDAKNLTKVGGLAYFSANDGTDTALWKTDGTLKGTQKIKAFDSSDSLSNFVSAGGFLYFVANDRATGSELWKSDGTDGGTRLVADLNLVVSGNGTLSSNPKNFVVAGEWLYFIANNSSIAGSEQFYRTNTTGTTIERVPGSQSAYIGVKNITFQGDTLFFSATAPIGPIDNPTSIDTELWTISNAGSSVPGIPTEQELHTGNTPATSSSPSKFVLASNGKLYGSASLTGSEDFSLVELTRNNNNTYSATAIGSANGLEALEDFVTVGNRIYFSGTTSADGRELRRLNTTTTSATLTSLDSINPGAGSSNPTNLVGVGDSVYFFAENSSGKGLWRDNGTTTTQIAIAEPGVNGAPPVIGTSPDELIAIGNTLYFTATNAAKGRELWSYDTTTNGTMKLRDINVQADPNNPGGTKSSNPGRLTNIDGALYFIADNGLDGIELMSL